jgi:hypothetical protein
VFRLCTNGADIKFPLLAIASTYLLQFALKSRDRARNTPNTVNPFQSALADQPSVLKGLPQDLSCSRTWTLLALQEAGGWTMIHRMS